MNLTTLNLSVSPPASSGRFVSLTPSKYSVSTTTTGDTFISESNQFAGNGDSATLKLNGSTGNRKTPFFRFDLSSQSGQQVTGDARFTLPLRTVDNPLNATQLVELRESTSAWNDNSTWSTIPGGPPAGSFGATVLDSFEIVYDPVEGEVSFRS